MSDDKEKQVLRTDKELALVILNSGYVSTMTPGYPDPNAFARLRTLLEASKELAMRTLAPKEAKHD